MATTAKTKSSRNRDSWGGMGFFLIFFPDLEEPMNPKKQPSKLPSFSPSSPASPPAPVRLPSFLRRASSANLLNKAQSTISICALLIFLSLLLFTLSTVDPLSTHQWKHNSPLKDKQSSNHHAFQKMGKLYRRGSRAMSDLLIGHVTESITSQQLRLFLRILHRSGLTSRVDIVFIFPSYQSSLETVIMEENDSFVKLVSESNSSASSAGFDLTHFVKSVKNGNKWGETIWGRRIRVNNNNYSREGGNESTRLSYGSVVGFSANELDPENSLAGFLDNVHMGFRRWATYPMLLGRLRRNFKHVALIDVSEILFIGDPLTRVRTQSPESVVFFTESDEKHSKKNMGKTQSHVVPGLVIGGARGVRRLSAAVLMEIVRKTGGGGSHKKKNSVSEVGVFDQLVRNEFLMKSANVVVTGTESISEVSSLNSNMNLDSLLSSKQKAVILRNSEILVSTLMKQICQQESDSSVYSEC